MSGSSPRRFGWLFWLVFASAIVVVALIAGRPSDQGEALSPDSTGPLGLKGMVDLLESFGAEVDVRNSAVGGFDAAFVPVPASLSQEQVDELESFARAGGRVVLAGPSEELSPEVLGVASGSGSFGDTLVHRGSCDMDELADAGTVEGAGGFAYSVDAGTRSCYGDAREALIVDEPVGEGAIVSVGGVGFFLNENLGAALGDDDDELVSNSVVAVRLMAPVTGWRVAFYEADSEALTDLSGDRSVVDFLSDGVKLGLVQLAIAFVIYALYRARRLGRPVDEPQPVEIAGCELVEAVGGLMLRSRSVDQASSLLREDVKRSLCNAFGLAPETPAHVIADTATNRLGIDREHIEAVLGDQPVYTEEQLVMLAHDLESIRREVFHGERC